MSSNAPDQPEEIAGFQREKNNLFVQQSVPPSLPLFFYYYYFASLVPPAQQNRWCSSRACGLLANDCSPAGEPNLGFDLRAVKTAATFKALCGIWRFLVSRK